MAPETPAADHYLEMVRRFPLRPIRDEATLDAAIAMTDELLTIAEPSPEQEDYQDVLGDLIHKYEEANRPIPKAPTADVLRYLMECRELSLSRLAEEADIPASIISEALSSGRRLGQADAIKLARYFHVGADMFL